MNLTSLPIHTPNRPSRLFLESKDLNFLVIIAVLLAGAKALHLIRGERTRRWSSVLLSIGLIAFSARCELKQMAISLSYGLLLSVLICCFKHNARLPLVTYLISFGLLTGLRFYYNVDPSLTAQTNLILMMVLLRSVSLAFDLQAFSDDRKNRELNLENVFTYLFCCFGLFIGPFYRYEVYKDWLTFDQVAQSDQIGFKDSFEQAEVSRNIDSPGRSDQTKSNRTKSLQLEKFDQQCKQLIIQRIPLLLSFSLIFLVGNVFFPLNSIVIKKSSFLELFAQTLLLFYIYRSRLYVGFILSEIICIFAGFGVYPSECDPKPGCGPTIRPITKSKTKSNTKPTKSDTDKSLEGSKKLEVSDKKRKNGINESETDDNEKTGYSAETIKCVCSVLGVELSGSVQYSLRHWNQTVQFWLQNYCYHKLKGNSDLLRMYLTLFVR